MKTCIKKLSAILIAVTVFSAVALVFSLSDYKIPSVGKTEGSVKDIRYYWDEDTQQTYIEEKNYVLNEDLAAIRITDIGDVNYISLVNYTPDIFVQPNTIHENSYIVDLSDSGLTLSEKGSLQLVILNLNPDIDNTEFIDQQNALEKYKIGDYWVFNLNIPPVFSACNIYNAYQCVYKIGEIENYDFIKFNTSDTQKTEHHVAETHNVQLTVNFYTRRETMLNQLSSAKIITIHYETEKSTLAGTSSLPLIGGSADEIEKYASLMPTLSFVCLCLAAVALAVFTVLCFLKRTVRFIPALCILFGTTLTMLCIFTLKSGTSAPFVFGSLYDFSILLSLSFSCLAIGKNFSRFPLNKIFFYLMLAGTVFSLFLYVLPENFYFVSEVIVTLFKTAGILYTTAFAVYGIFDKNYNLWRMIPPFTLALAAGLSLIIPDLTGIYPSPAFIMSTVTVVSLFVFCLYVFAELERRNRYLTENMQSEINNQTNRLNELISERDKMLVFVSHDLRKPLTYSKHLLETLVTREENPDQMKTQQIVKNKVSDVINELSDVARFSKFNLIAEKPEILNGKDICAKITESFSFDCNANGIVLENHALSDCYLYAKPKTLDNVLTNIIINAIEHADCTKITVSSAKKKNTVEISVADDGKGVFSETEIFRPYVSENSAEETRGVGLYICKQSVESMNGTIVCNRTGTHTVFTLSLPKA